MFYVVMAVDEYDLTHEYFGLHHQDRDEARK